MQLRAVNRKEPVVARIKFGVKRSGGPRAGDIGEPLRHIELEPLTEPSQVPVAPSEPVREPEVQPA